VAFLTPGLHKTGASYEVAIARADLERAMGKMAPDTRLISFAATVIVPAAFLGRFSGPSYNFHPGPPAYPGLFPSVYAIYDGATTFAITLHEMAAQVDSGAIVAVETFALPEGANRVTLDTMTFAHMVKVFEKWIPKLAGAARLPRSDDQWSGKRRTRADFNTFCELGEDPSPEEFERRLNAAGEGPEHALTLSRFGRRFRLVSDPNTVVLRGGVEVGGY
jgi:methionyl-tRNA formyltransferase